MYKNKNVSNHSQKRHYTRPLLLVAVVLLLVGGALLLTYKHARKGTTQSATAATTAQVVHNAPATPAEKQSSDANKDRIVADQSAQQTPQDTSTQKTVTPIITHADGSVNPVEVNAFVPGIVADGGTCTLKLTLGSASISRTTTGVANSSSTNCPQFTVERSAFPSGGSWTATVSYSSSTASGTSAPTTVAIK